MARNPELEWLKRENLWLRQMLEAERERNERLTYSLMDRALGQQPVPAPAPFVPNLGTFVEEISDVGSPFVESDADVKSFREKYNREMAEINPALRKSEE